MGDWFFNVIGILCWVFCENWGMIFEVDRDLREVIKVVGDVYCDIFYDKFVVVLWGRFCVRLEGGVYIGNGG